MKARHVNKPEERGIIYVDGAGADPNGVSGYAWVREGQKQVQWGTGWTNNEAEYRAVLSALESVPKNAQVEIRSDSVLVIRQLSGEYQINQARLSELAEKIMRIISERSLDVAYHWVRRQQNDADKLLRRRPQVQQTAHVNV